MVFMIMIVRKFILIHMKKRYKKPKNLRCYLISKRLIMINTVNENDLLICNIPKRKLDKLLHGYVNPTFYGKIKTLKDNDR